MQTGESRAKRDPLICKLSQVKQLCTIKTVPKSRDAKQSAAGIKHFRSQKSLQNTSTHPLYLFGRWCQNWQRYSVPRQRMTEPGMLL